MPPDVRSVITRDFGGTSGATQVAEPIQVTKGTASFHGFTADDVSSSETP